jgi:hypothetical protein
MNLIGKRFIFGVVAIVCVSYVSYKLSYPAIVYKDLVLSIVGLFMVSQSVTDMKKP